MSADRPIAPEPVTRSVGRVLVVDDDAAVGRAFKRILATAGHTVALALDGESAIATLEKESFDVIVSDIAMPGISGVELLRRVRQRDLDVPVILATAAPTVATAAEAVELGALRYLSKPVPSDTLLAAVDQAVRLHQMAKLKREALAVVGAMGMGVGDRAGLEVRFEAAMQGLWMAYQPIVDWKASRLFAHEALMRSAETTLATPSAVLAAAERLARVPHLGRRIRAQVAADCAAVIVPAIFVNLHPSDLLDDELYDPATPLGTIASRVVLEVTERASLDDVTDVRTRVKLLRDLGYRVAVDDLGAGYAGLTSFAQLEPDFVKLDMALIRDIDTEATKRKLVGSMTALCHDLGIEVIAEGVETPSERDTLVELGCTKLQGYLFGRPGAGFPRPVF